MLDRKIEQCGDFQIATALGELSWVSWAKMGQIIANDPIREPGEHVWFEFGSSRQEASDRLKVELGLQNA